MAGTKNENRGSRYRVQSNYLRMLACLRVVILRRRGKVREGVVMCVSVRVRVRVALGELMDQEGINDEDTFG